MKKEIIINATDNEIRIAITEDNRLAELYVETPEKERMVGDIYLGRVANVKPGIRAAFIDIGQKQDAFLHFSDIGDSFQEYSSLVDEDEGDDDEEEVNSAQPALQGGGVDSNSQGNQGRGPQGSPTGEATAVQA